MAVTAETNNLRKSNAMNLPYGVSWDGLGFRLYNIRPIESLRRCVWFFSKQLPSNPLVKHHLFLSKFPGWWYTYPSGKYESQLDDDFQYMEK